MRSRSWNPYSSSPLFRIAAKQSVSLLPAVRKRWASSTTITRQGIYNRIIEKQME